MCVCVGGGGGCSEVLWDTRLYHDSEGVGGGGGGHGLSPRVGLITRVTKHASMPARFAGEPQKKHTDIVPFKKQKAKTNASIFIFIDTYFLMEVVNLCLCICVCVCV